MNIAKIDKNFDTSFTSPEDLVWFSCLESPFKIYGVVYSEEDHNFHRMPKDIAYETNDWVGYLSLNTAGGRIRFTTDSPYIVLRVEEPFEEPMSHMTIEGKDGFSIFSDGSFKGSIMPSYRQILKADPSYGGNGTILFDGMKDIRNEGKEKQLIEIFMPLYSSVNTVYIGLKKDSFLTEPREYKYRKPVLFYGSSITQGGCASKPGDDYISRLSRMLDFDFVNLGFSGSAKAERTIAEYIASQDPSVFVLDYDYNAPDAEHLKKTHFALYETVRRSHAETPIIFMTMPNYEGYEKHGWNKARRDEIIKSYEKAKEAGDNNVYFIDCYGCLGKEVTGECGTVDGVHPDSLGFLRMAEYVYPTLSKLLEKK